YGALGTVLIVQSWLIGAGWAVYGGQLFGRWFHDAWLRAWADSRRDHKEPGGGEGGQDADGQSPPAGERGRPRRAGPPPGISGGVSSWGDIDLRGNCNDSRTASIMVMVFRGRAAAGAESCRCSLSA